MKRSNVLVLSAMLMAVSCSKVKEAGDMPATTKEMKSTTESMDSKMSTMTSTTEEMSQTTKDMSGTTKDMKAVTTAMYEQLRSKESESTRSAKFKEILNKNNDICTKITEAAVYFKSFEFQLATFEELSNNPYSIEVLRLDAVNEITRRLADLYAKIKPNKMSPTNAGKKHSDELAFYAIAAAMHMNHHYQDHAAAQLQIKTVSYLDIIKTALKKEQNGEVLMEYEDILLTGINREISMELLKARVDMLSAIALSYMTDKRQMGLGGKAQAGLYKLTDGRIGKITVPTTLEKSNASTKRTTARVLEEALKTREFLRELGVEKPLEKDLRSAYKNLSFESVEDRKAQSEIDNINDMVQRLLQ